MPSGCLEDGESSYEPTPWDLLRRSRQEPRSIRAPEEWTGGEFLAIACTQTELPARQQRALVQAWCEALPTLNGVRWLWFNSRVPQELFDAACRLPALEGQWLKWNGMQDMAAAEGHATLSHLHLGESARLAPLAALTGLRWLGLPNRFEMAEYAQLSRHLTATRGAWLAPVERFHRSVFPCPKCKANCRVMTTGRGSKLLCPDCDAAALAKKVAAWTQAAA